MTLSRRIVIVLMSAAASLGCGGAGQGGGSGASGPDLAVTYEYPWATVTRFFSASVVPTLIGLDGHTPHFQVVSGALPAGLSLDPATGTVSGVPTAPPAIPVVTVRLTVDGYRGSLDSQLTVEVKDLYFDYDGGSPPAFEIGLPISLSPFVGTLGPGVAASFSADAVEPLPAGLTVDPTSGEITGALSSVTSTTSKVNLSILYHGQTYPYSTTLRFAASPPNVGLLYWNAPVGATYAFNLTTGVPMTGGQGTLEYFGDTPVPGDALSGFTQVLGKPAFYGWGFTNALPPGLALDPVLGTITGTPSSAGQYYVAIDAVFSRGTYSAPVEDVVNFNVQ